MVFFIVAQKNKTLILPHHFMDQTRLFNDTNLEPAQFHANAAFRVVNKLFRPIMQDGSLLVLNFGFYYVYATMDYTKQGKDHFKSADLGISF